MIVLENTSNFFSSIFIICKLFENLKVKNAVQNGDDSHDQFLYFLIFQYLFSINYIMCMMYIYLYINV